MSVKGVLNKWNQRRNDNQHTWTLLTGEISDISVKQACNESFNLDLSSTCCPNGKKKKQQKKKLYWLLIYWEPKAISPI